MQYTRPAFLGTVCTLLALATLPSAYAAASFDGNTRLLSMDTVTLTGGARYNTVGVTIHDYAVLGVDGGVAGANSFDAASSLLTLGSVTYAGSTYTNVRVRIGAYTVLYATTLPVEGTACGTANAQVASASGMQLSLGVSRSSGVAPLAVFFDASNTTAASTTRPFHELEYRWSFGDSSSGVWTQGAKAGTASRNEAMGPVAAHVFESAGTFPITVSAFNGSSTVSYSCNITVTAADTEFAGNKTVCVSGTGNFAGCPAGAAQVTSANATTAVSGNIGTGNKRILFARGETFSVGASISINQPGPSVIGAYGNSAFARPAFTSSVSGPVFYLSSSDTPTQVSKWVIQDISIDGGNLTNSSAFAGGGSFSNVLINRVYMTRVGFGLVLSGSVLAGLNSAVPFTHAMWDQVYMVDSTIYDLQPITGGPNAVFANASRIAFLGNNIDNNGHGEHGIRMQLTDRGVFEHNTIQGIAPGKVNLTIRGGGFEGGNTIAPGRYSEKIVMSDNRLIGGASPGMVGIGPQNGFNDERGRDMIFERNLLLATASIQNLMTIAQPDITIRNNLISIPTTTNGGSAFGIQPSGIVPNPTRVHVYNNSVYYGGNASNFWSLLNVSANNDASPHDQTMPGSVFELRNNILYAPDRVGTNAVMFSNTNGSVAVTNQSNNTVNPSASPLFATSPPTAVSHFTPGSGSYANGTGTSVKVYSDFYGIATQSPPDMGAVSH
jgi:hypothetical protein